MISIMITLWFPFGGFFFLSKNDGSNSLIRNIFIEVTYFLSDSWISNLKTGQYQWVRCLNIVPQRMTQSERKTKNSHWEVPTIIYSQNSKVNITSIAWKYLWRPIAMSFSTNKIAQNLSTLFKQYMGTVLCM